MVMILIVPARASEPYKEINEVVDRREVSPVYDALSITAVAVALPVLASALAIVTVGGLVYPFPLSVMITLVIEFPVSTAVAVAVFPGLVGALMATEDTIFS